MCLVYQVKTSCFFSTHHSLLDQKWFQKILSVPTLGKFFRQGEVIPSIPKNIVPKRIPFYFDFLPRLATSDLNSKQELQVFRDNLQQQIYTAIDDLKIRRATEH